MEEDMKKTLPLFVLFIALIVSFTACDLLMGDDGDDGISYMKVSVDMYADAWYGKVEGFPSGWSLDTYYEMTEGSHYMEYALCECYYNSSTYDYDYYINSYDTTYSSAYDSSSYSTEAYNILLDYLSYGYSVYTNTISIEVNKGTSGELLRDGTDGEDTYYNLYLDWYPEDSTISSDNVVLSKTVTTTDEGATILRFTDEYRTFTINIPEKTGVPSAASEAGVRSKRDN
jgi:hypothetical protein